MKIMITGISGFLGSHLAGHFAKAHQVCGVSTSVASLGNIPVYDYEHLEAAERPDVIIHCHAAVASGNTVLDKETLRNGNIYPTQKIIGQFPEAKHIYISSVSVYGQNQETITETTAISPFTAYAQSKYEAEQIIASAPKSAIIRLSSLFGTGMKENTLIPNYVNQALQNGQIEVWGTGERMQNYFHVSDAAALIDAMIQKNTWNQPVYLGVSEKEYSNIEIARTIAIATGARIVHLNDDTSVSVHYDNTFTRKNLNWHPEMQTTEAIKAYIQWKKRQY